MMCIAANAKILNEMFISLELLARGKLLGEVESFCMADPPSSKEHVGQEPSERRDHDAPGQA
jgi:hypothetical protein